MRPNWYKLFYNFSFNTFFFQFTGSSTSSTVSRQNSETPNFTDNSSRRTIQTPSPSVTFKTHIRARPKSFAQKFRPNSRLAGYSSGELRFIYSEKATQFCEIFSLLLTVYTVVKSKGKISQNFVAFSEYMNFN